MKRRHLFAFYCTLLVPIGVVAGLGAGQIVGGSAALVIVGAIGGFAASCFLLRRTAPDEIP